MKLLLLLSIISKVFAQDNLTIQYLVDVIDQGKSEAFSGSCTLENAHEFTPETQSVSEFGSFDYIIVGAGSTGAVLATRLSEDQNLKILLLEAGDDENTFNQIPEMSVYLQRTRMNWNFKSTPQNTSCLGVVDRRCTLPRGRALGGSSSINAMMYARGNRADFDGWANMGNPGWSYRDVLPYFIKSENSEVDGDPGFHGKGGLWNVEYHTPFNPENQLFLKANVQRGRKILDYNGESQLGVSRIQQNTLRGQRASSNRAFLQFARDRCNLRVLTNAYVTKILINRQKVAYGVQFSHNNTLYVARVNKEVIVSAGTFQSPQILMLSGIGPTSDLRSLGIPVVQNLPGVGSNLQDHATFYGLFFTNNHTVPIHSEQLLAAEYLQGHGPLTVSQNHQGIGFFQSSLENTTGLPDIEVLMIPANGTNDFIKYAFDYTQEVYDSFFADIDPRHTFGIYVLLLHPRSRGTVRLNSTNPYDYPLINTRFLSDPKNEDIEIIYQGVQLMLDLVKAPAFQSINASLYQPALPACKSYPYLSKEFWYCQIRQISLANYHPIGTCRMGPRARIGSVVDSQLRVYGVSGLRVADASVFPSTISGHTAAAAVMVGEKLSDMLRGRRTRCTSDS